jgi:hypothetical protein
MWYYSERRNSYNIAEVSFDKHGDNEDHQTANVDAVLE